MVYPRRIDWRHGAGGRPTRPLPRGQRDLVAASLQCRPETRLRWDERTRAEYREPAR